MFYNVLKRGDLEHKLVIRKAQIHTTQSRLKQKI